MMTVEHQSKAQPTMAIQPGLKMINARAASLVNAAAGIAMAASAVNALTVAMTPAKPRQQVPSTQRLVSQASSLIYCQMSLQTIKYGRKKLLN